MIPQEVAASASPEVSMNENFRSIQNTFVYGIDPRTSSGTTLTLFAGRWGGNAYAGGNLTLTDAADNYVVVARSTGVPSVSTATTNWNDTDAYARVFKITLASGAWDIDSDVEDHRMGPYGVHGQTASASSADLRGLVFTSDTGSAADSDPGAGLFRWNHATQASATELYFDDTTADAQSLTTLWGNVGHAGFIFLQQDDDATKWQLWRWTAIPVDGTGYRKFTVSLQASGGSIADAKTVYALFTNDRSFVAPRVTSTASSVAPTPNADTTDVYILTALATDPTFGAPTGSPVQGQPLLIRIKDDATPRALAWNAIYRATDIALPTTTTASKELYVGFIYDATATKWDLMGTREVA